MGRESIEACPLCQSICRTVECSDNHKCYKPMVVVGSDGAAQKAELVAMLRDSKYCAMRLEKAMTMLMHVEEFLRVKGHKFMHLEVQRTLEQLRDRRETPP